MFETAHARVDTVHGQGKRAGQELATAALEDLPQDNEQIAFVFVSSAYNSQAFADGFEEVFDGDWIGATTAGEIDPDGPHRETAVCLVIESDELSIQVTTADDVFTKPEKAGQETITALQSALDTDANTLLYTLIPGSSQDHLGVEYDVLQGMAGPIDTATPLVGAAAGDDFWLQGTKTFYNGTTSGDMLVVAALESEHRFVTGQEHGLTRTLTSGVVNKSDDHRLEIVNGTPAAEFYADAIDIPLDELQQWADTTLKRKIYLGLEHVRRQIVGERSFLYQKILEYSLQHTIATELGTDRLQPVTPVQITDDHSIVMSRPIRENQPLHIVEGDREDIIAAAGDAFSNIDEEPLFAILADCATRAEMFDADERDQEITTLAQTLDCPFLGFYAYGEIGAGQEGLYTLNNQTVTGFVLVRDHSE